MNEILALVAVLGVISGAAVNTARGWYNAPDDQKYSVKKLLGSALLAGVQAPLAIGVATLFGSLGDTGYVVTFFMEFSQGFTIDIAHTATKN